MINWGNDKMRRYDASFHSFGKWNSRKTWMEYNQEKISAIKIIAGIIAICALMVAGLMLGI